MDTTFLLHNCRSKGARNGCLGLATGPTTLHPAKLPMAFKFIDLIVAIGCKANTIYQYASFTPTFFFL
jgi:hypothetical protein